MILKLGSRSELTTREWQFLRFVFGVTLSIALAYAINWPLSFVAPVFTAKFLAPGTPRIPLKLLVSILMVIATAFILAILFTKVLVQYPIVFMMCCTLIVFWIAYWANSGGNEFVITMLLVGLTLVPLLSFMHPALVTQVTLGLLFSCLIALTIAMISNELFIKGTSPAAKKTAQAQLDKATKTKLAMLTTVLIIPMLAFFLFNNLTGGILVIVFIAIMALKPDIVAGVQGAKALLIGNALGGVAAIVVYNFLIIAPNYTFAILVYASAICLFTLKILKEDKLAPIYTMALTTMIIIVSGASLGDGGASSKFYTRLGQIALACTYIIFAMFVVDWLTTRRKNRQSTK
ncbi:DUF2955 domain-containing protein [Thalassotalea agarivorans]|uniref:Fusaric acid resistance protein-like n=1 Tax=Thalassotalea agarivorans TaxID=349064 RepID=A0A1H9YCX8_THASX|nr:DUF2955 domain-containing protein [Thalassotalea agarivorans]SES66403.1 Fusaric acid resistance protein-like [Thalassotalea agarivorans]